MTERIGVARSSALPEELRARVVSGLALGVLALAANWAGVGYLGALVILVSLVMSWEWGRVVRGRATDARGIVHAATVLAAGGMALVGQPALAVVVIAVGALVSLSLRFDRHAPISALGVAYVALPAVVLIWLRSDSHALASAAVLFLFVVVWTTDTFSYVCGKLLGGPRLWPALSPAKTWAGTIGGVVFAGVAGLVFAYITEYGDGVRLLLTAVALSIAAQVGDLTESALKRAHGVKHVSQLIPGHGGFMDRMDGIVAAALVAGLLALVVDYGHPARAMIQGQ